MLSFETLRNMIVQPSEEPDGAKKKGVRSASEIVKDKKDSQYFATFLAQCGDSDEVKEAYRKQLAHEPLTGEELAIIGEAVCQFEESIKIANELHDKIYKSPYFEGFFNTFVEKYNHVVTAKQFKDTLLNHLHLLAVTGGDAIKEFANAFDAYTQASTLKADLEKRSIKLSKDYELDGILSTSSVFGTLAEKAKQEKWSSEQIRERIRDVIQNKYPGTTPETTENILNIILKSPDGEPIENIFNQAGSRVAETLENLYGDTTKGSTTLFTESLSVIGQTGNMPERPKKYNTRKTMEESKDVKVSEEEIREKREGFKEFQKNFHETHPGYPQETNEDTMLDVFLQEQNALYDTKMSKGKKVGWLERFLRTVRDTYIKGKIKTS